MRIGEVAAAVGTTARTIRYYEEIGLLGRGDQRESGSHRIYTEDDVALLSEVLRLKDLLGVSLDELRELVADQDARRALREEFSGPDTSDLRRGQILDELAHVADRQPQPVARRRVQLDELEAEVQERRGRIAERRAELDRTTRVR